MEIMDFPDTQSILDFLKDKQKIGIGQYLMGRVHEIFGYQIDKTIGYLTHGYYAPEINIGVDKIAENMRDIEFRYTVEHNVTGNWLDVGRYLSGEPECFGDMVTDYESRKYVKIVVNTTVSWTIPENEIRNRGAAIMALIDHLNKTGYDIDLIAVSCIDLYEDRPREQYELRFHLDCSTTEYSRDIVAFWVTAPEVQRSLMFAIYEGIRGKKDLGGYGSPMDYRKKGNEIVFNGYGRDFSTIESATDYVKGIIKEMERSE